MAKKLIYPSLIAADQLNLQQEITRLENYIDGYHLDIMDDHFVPNLALNIDTVNQIGRVTKKPLFVHLMVEFVDELVERLTLPAGSTISFHSHKYMIVLRQAQDERGHSHSDAGEWLGILVADLAGLVEKIKRKDWRLSIALSPGQPVHTIEPLLDQVDNVLVMSVMPGFSGQDFMPVSLSAIDELVVQRRDHNLKFTIAIDGGIDANNIVEVTARGADIVCVGSGIFGQPDRVKAVEQLQESLARLTISKFETAI